MITLFHWHLFGTHSFQVVIFDKAAFTVAPFPSAFSFTASLSVFPALLPSISSRPEANYTISYQMHVEKNCFLMGQFIYV